MKDFISFIKFCKIKFNPNDYFKADSICTDCIKKDFKNFKIIKIDKLNESSAIHLEKRYGKTFKFSFISLTLSNNNKDSSSISFHTYPTYENISSYCYEKELGKPTGHNQDSSSVFWGVDKKGIIELGLKERSLIFYTTGYQDLHWDIEGHYFRKISIVDRIIIDSLPKLPYLEVFTNELKKNASFYEDNYAFNAKNTKAFGINFLEFCRENFDNFTKQFATQKRDIKEFNDSVDSLKTECFKNQKIYRGSNIEIYSDDNIKPNRLIEVTFRIACYSRQYDYDETNKKERILRTLNFLTRNSKLENDIKNITKYINDFINDTDLNTINEAILNIDNYRVHLHYNKLFFTVFITMPRFYYIHNNF